jgi:hypothetical protein
MATKKRDLVAFVKSPGETIHVAPPGQQTRRPFAKRECVFTKTDREHGIAYGWAIVSSIGGEPYYDLHGDHIPRDACIAAAARFMEKSRVSDDQHDEVAQGFVPFCMPVYKGITDSLLDVDIGQEGLIIGAKCSSETLDKIDAGERRGYSIGGSLSEAIYVEKHLATAAHLAAFTATHNGKLLGKRVRGTDLEKHDLQFVAMLGKARTTKTEPSGRRIFVDFDIDFISTVDWPAQEGALISVVKSAKGAVLYIAKNSYLTSEEDGHQHVVTLGDYHVSEDGSRGWTSYSTSEGEDNGHSHDFVIDLESGAITIASTNGHGHTIDAKAKIQGSTPELADGTQVLARAPNVDGDAVLDAVIKSRRAGPRDTPRVHGAGQISKTGLASTTKERDMDPEQLKKEIADLKKRNEELSQIAEMGDAERSYFKSLGKRDQETFLAKSQRERDAEVKKADDDDILYKCDDGVSVIRKRDGEVAARHARRADEAYALAKKNADAAEAAAFEKRADVELKSYPGKSSQRAALLKAAEGIADEPTRKAALAALAAGEKALAKAFVRKGRNVVDDPASASDDPTRQLDELAKKYAKENKVSIHKAYDEVLKTEEGADLYAESQQMPPGASGPEVDDFEDDDGDDGFEVVVDESDDEDKPKPAAS